MYVRTVHKERGHELERQQGGTHGRVGRKEGEGENDKIIILKKEVFF